MEPGTAPHLRRVVLEKLEARGEIVRRRLSELLEAEYEEVRVRSWARELQQMPKSS